MVYHKSRTGEKETDLLWKRKYKYNFIANVRKNKLIKDLFYFQREDCI